MMPICALTNPIREGLSSIDAPPTVANMVPPPLPTPAWNTSRNASTLPVSSSGALVSDTQQGADVAGFDAEVRALVLAGRERHAADLLLTRLSPELRPFLHRLLGDVALADEAHSNTCERLWRGLPTFRWECSLRSWSYIIARREASRCRVRHARDGVQQTTLSKLASHRPREHSRRRAGITSPACARRCPTKTAISWCFASSAAWPGRKLRPLFWRTTIPARRTSAEKQRDCGSGFEPFA